ncbi:beta-ketoacyl-ACP synthase [Pseudohalioglobus sediminis]|uniref:Beta-ketoacyl-ACP synthase n=1 Tax=Pseudohalioglobus sediminis TaxID=2606449 RepID=A0A5B0WU93_9GAMM|nr:beta-ketoacyl-ACP synthase [Pseudohalioglobus sediminis]KAA1190493.1 beta-ketoacyl-ACP synthase [Pseudohalioglobus sediminis]
MYHLNDLGMLCTLGSSPAEVAASLLDSENPVPEPETLFASRGSYRVGQIHTRLTKLPTQLANYNCRNNRLAATALDQIRPAVDRAANKWGRDRVGVVMATSTSGIHATEEAVLRVLEAGSHPDSYHAYQGMLGGLGDFSANYLGLTGPTYTISTACSSSANAALSARRLLTAGLCDAVVFGGVDSLCEMTLQGFGSLEAQSAHLNMPLSVNRDGINIGEAAAIFLMSSEAKGPVLAGGCASSDAHHISAPHPEGDGAYQAMSGALRDAGLAPEQIGYINLHGTATRQNDSMESKAVSRLFPKSVPCSSSKSMTGHTLGAAGALELGFCWLLLQTDGPTRLPPALYQEEVDPALPLLHLANAEAMEATPAYCLSNSFAFGGSNVSLIIGRLDER